MKNYLSINLKFLREKYDLSQQKLADELGMKRGTYSKYEDKVNEPTILTLFKIKNFYKLKSIDDLVFTNIKNNISWKQNLKNQNQKNQQEKISPENKKRILTNGGKAIGKFMEMKKVSIPLLAKKTGIKIADINDFITGKKAPTKTQLKLMYKALDVPKEVIMLYSIEEQDVSPRKRELFNQLMPSILGLVDDVVKNEPEKLKSKKTKKTKVKK